MERRVYRYKTTLEIYVCTNVDAHWSTHVYASAQRERERERMHTHTYIYIYIYIYID